MKNSRNNKIILFALICIILLSTTIAYAYTEFWGNYTTYTSGSNTVKHASYMFVSGSSIAARTIVMNNASQNLAAGWLGLYPRAYYSSGSLAAAGEWSYTSSAASSFDSPIYVDGYAGYLYSQGRSALWNGTGYTTSTTTASPNAKAETTKTAIMDIQLNSSGKTFGSSLYVAKIEDEPDLILATGIDGTEGYVKKSDLYEDMAKSPEEAVMIMKSKSSSEARFIPLYNSEGTIVIGKFKITPPNQTQATKTIIEN